MLEFFIKILLTAIVTSVLKLCYYTPRLILEIPSIINKSITLNETQVCKTKLNYNLNRSYITSI